MSQSYMATATDAATTADDAADEFSERSFADDSLVSDRIDSRLTDDFQVDVAEEQAQVQVDDFVQIDSFLERPTDEAAEAQLADRASFDEPFTG